MAFETPSWLNLPNFVAAMREGANVGLSQRQQEREEASAADRLREAYAALESKERIAGERVKAMREDAQARRTSAAAALMERVNQAKALQDYREKTLNKPSIHFGTRGEILSASPSGDVSVLRGPEAGTEKLDQTTDALMNVDVKRLSELEKAVDKAVSEKADPKQIGDLIASQAYLRSRIAGYRKQHSAADALMAPQSGLPTTNKSPFKILNIRKKEAPSLAPTDDSETGTGE